jgi:SAM-dependent methyltransferase
VTEVKSETAKYRHLTRIYCEGCGVDVASQGDPVVPWAINFDLPRAEFNYYNSHHPPHGPIQLRGHADNLPFEDNSLDFCYCSHLLEDYPEERWPSIFKEWARTVKPGGYLIILIPDRELWVAACAAGQPPNDAHRREGEPGLMSKYATAEGLKVIKDELTNLWPGDYSILGVFKKPLKKLDIAEGKA